MIRCTQLDNGIRVVTELLPHVRSATIGFWYRVGSRDESSRLSGMSHLIEHMLFKGTSRQTARDIAEAIDSAGGQLNAYTSKEHTCFYARVLDTHVELAIDTLADMLRNSLFDPEHIEKEKNVVMEEIHMLEDTPDELIHDVFSEAILGDHPLGRPVLGNIQSVRSMQRDDILSFFNEKYDANNLVVAAAGNVDHDAVVRMVKERFDDLHANGNKPTAVVVNTKPNHRVIEKDLEQVHICIGSESLRREHADEYALYTLDIALGGGMSSRLFQQLREDRGLVYSTYSYHSCFHETGLFAVYAGTSPENTEEVIQIIRENIHAAMQEGFSADELHRAKEQLKGSLMLGLEHSANRMSRIARNVLFDEERLTVDQLIAKIDAVTQDDLRRVTTEVFKDGLTVAAIGQLSQPMVAGFS